MFSVVSMLQYPKLNEYIQYFGQIKLNNTYKRFRYPDEIISHAVWLHYRFFRGRVFDQWSQIACAQNLEITWIDNVRTILNKPK